MGVPRSSQPHLKRWIAEREDIPVREDSTCEKAKVRSAFCFPLNRVADTVVREKTAQVARMEGEFQRREVTSRENPNLHK
jgi:hypothetical protein